MSGNHIQIIRDLLESFDTAMLVTHGEEFPFHARPMAIASVAENCDVWFLTSESSVKVDEIQHDQSVLVICQNDAGRYVAVRGRARVVEDHARTTELWQDGFRVWFPKGPKDPDLRLIHVRAEDAEYWSNEGLESVRYLFEAARAYVRGTKPHVGKTERHGSVSFSG